jgi:hypothetical protein
MEEKKIVTAKTSFPLELDPVASHYENVKWTLTTGRQEVHVPLLAKYELPDVVAHCLNVMFRIDAKVTTPLERYLSYQDVFPRTLSIPLRATWDNIVAEHPLAMGLRNVQGFHGLIRFFVAAHATDNDCHGLVNHLRQAPKPRSMGVGTYYYRLCDLNEQVPWLPGTEAKLTNIQLDQAFHDGMPQTWQDRYANAGHSVASDEHTNILSFFRQQQATAERSLLGNVGKQKNKMKGRNGQL